MANPRYKRSTNVVYDFGDKSSTQGIIITNPIQSLVKNLYLASSVENASKAISIIGPYGTGKSSLALFLQALINGNAKIKKLAINKSKFNSKGNFAKLFLSKNKWFVLKIIGSKSDPIEAFAEHISQNIKQNWISKGIPPSLKTKIKPTVAGIIKSLTNLTQELNKKNYGLLIVVDEMGKYLEHASSVGSDLNLFQEIAENFSNLKLKKQGLPIFIGVLHQPMEEYASNLGRSVQEDWQKDNLHGLDPDKRVFL